MTQIIKCYVDIGCHYEGEDAIQNIYEDIENWNIKDCGIISILKLNINKEQRKSEEILFKQILSPMHHKFKCSINDYRRYASCILKEFKDIDLLVTFNGRDFDIPIILNNLNLSNKQKEYYIRYFTNKDRDLLDWCILKNFNTKGGLKDISKRLNLKIKNNINDNFSQYIDKYNYRFLTKKKKNEEDIRTLPLLEEKLGLLYEARSYADKYHKKW